MNKPDTSRLALNLLHFCRTLRTAGMPIGTARILESLRAVATVGLKEQADVQAALRCALTADPAEFPIFDQAFRLYFGPPVHSADGGQNETLPLDALFADHLSQRLIDAESGSAAVSVSQRPAEQYPGGLSFSAEERLRRRDFANMTAEEQLDARKLLSARIEPLKRRASRRFIASATGNRYDLRRTMQRMIRTGAEPVQLARKAHRQRSPVLVLLCDTSASMRHYSRLFLHFAHLMSVREADVHSFVFGTRLNNITRLMQNRDADMALAGVSQRVRDWEGGTRIASSLRTFNRDWARRILARDSVVVLLTDGLERDTEADLAFETGRLRRSCRELIWLNPLLRFSGFEPRASGIRKMLPHVDRFVPAHNVDSLLELGSLLNTPLSRRALHGHCRSAA